MPIEYVEPWETKWCRKDANVLRAVHFDKPSAIPIEFSINPSCWNSYPEDMLRDLIQSHPILFPDPLTAMQPPSLHPWQRKDEKFEDSWGCVWESLVEGMEGSVVSHPLKTWDPLPEFKDPDPATHNGWGPLDWAAEDLRLRGQTKQGALRKAQLRRGHTFLTLTFIRGFPNVAFDMADGDLDMRSLLERIVVFNEELVRRYMDLGVEWLDIPEDLGMQTGPMISPQHFRKYLRSAYLRLIRPAKKSDSVVRMRCYGNIQLLATELTELGLDVLGLQDMPNGIDWIAANLKGKICLDVNMDRQILAYGAADDVNRHTYLLIKKLGGRSGGLMLHHELMPGVSVSNCRALMDSLEKYLCMFC